MPSRRKRRFARAANLAVLPRGEDACHGPSLRVVVRLCLSVSCVPLLVFFSSNIKRGFPNIACVIGSFSI